MRISEKFKIVSVELLKSGWCGVRVAETNYKGGTCIRQYYLSNNFVCFQK